MEIGQLGHAHVQHLPHTGLQVRQRRPLQDLMERSCFGSGGVPYHDLAGGLAHFSVSDVVRLLGGGQVFPLEDQKHVSEGTPSPKYN